MPKKAAYKTLTQAAHAARKLGIQTSTQYRQQCIEDPLLPYSPEKVYVASWEGWPAFLGTKRERTSKVSARFYPMYSQAKLAVRLLRINWVSWHHFLGTAPIEDRFYKTIRQASAATKALKITSARDYVRRYKLDSKLPSTPYQFYKNWVSWSNFLGSSTPR